MNKKFVILSIIVALLVIGTITISSYAYFSISNKEGTESVITSGTMALSLADGNEVTANSLLPGQSIEKEFSVENTGNIDSSYDIYLSEVINNFIDKTDLVYEITSLDRGYNTTSQIQVPNVSTKVVNQQPISVGDIHHYKLKITFLNKNENQDDNQGKVFSAKIQVNEYKDIETTINYYLDNVLVNTMPTNDNNYINSTCDKNGSITFDETNWTYTTNIVQNNTTCNIYFEIPEYTLTYDYNYEGSTPTTKKIKLGGAYGTLPSPTRTGWTFLGWYTDSTNGTQVTVNDIISEDTRIYARWQQSTLAAHVKSLVGKDSTVIKDTTTDQNTRYVGATVNNYVKYNNQNWRIIGVFGDNVKIVRQENTGSKKYSEAITYLDGDYYNRLNTTAKNMIQSYNFRVGRSKDTGYEKILTLYNNEKSSTATHNVSLINASDYIFASNKSCWDYNYYTNSHWNKSKNANPNCPTLDWLYASSTNNNIYYTTINQTGYSGIGNNANYWGINAYEGYMSDCYAQYYSYVIWASLYLKNTVKVEVSSTSNGTSTYPYKLSI